MSGFLVPGAMGPVAMAAGAAAADWWLAAGTIALDNVLEHVENPTVGQQYVGGTLTSAWTVSLRTNLAAFDTGIQRFAFDAQLGRIAIGLSFNNNGIYTLENSWLNITLFALTDHSYCVVSTGSSIQCYRDNSAIGAPITAAGDIGGVVRWASAYNSVSSWTDAIRAGHVANVALDATQRAALHAAMMALA